MPGVDRNLIKAGWKPNRRISGMGYDDSAHFFGVYVWEYINVLSSLIQYGHCSLIRQVTVDLQNSRVP